MTMSAEDLDPQVSPTAGPSAAGAGPVVEETAWGYIIRESDADRRIRAVGSVAGRFFGAILLLAGAGLWIMPDSLHGAELFGMKLAAMVMFTVFGGYFVWAGRNALTPEYRIDTHHNEIRIGLRRNGESFEQTARVDFADVSSVFLLRAKDRPTRLYLRLADLSTGIEVTAGNRIRMETLKERLAEDLTGPHRTAPRNPVKRPRRVASHAAA